LPRNSSILQVILFSFLLIVFLYVDYLGLRNLFRYNSYKKELFNKRKQLDEIMVINQNYKHKLLDMQTDEYWILEIKKNLGFIQKDEIVYKFYK
jgi:hypothetical protein